MKNNSTWKIIDIIRWGSEYFKDKNIDSPRLTIELLLCKILNCQRISLYTNFEKPLNDEELSELKGFIKRRINHEPLQYILGKTNFYNTELFLNNNSLIPRPETELLVQSADQILTRNNKIRKILDIGTGSGCIVISLAKKYPSIMFYAIDKNAESLLLAKENAKYNKLNNIIFIELDILNTVPEDKFDMIVSNPPYISYKEYLQLDPEVLQFEPKEALTDFSDGLTFFRRFSEIFPIILNQNGIFILEIGYNQSNDVSQIFNQKGYELDFIKDWNKVSRIAIGKFNR